MSDGPEDQKRAPWGFIAKIAAEKDLAKFRQLIRELNDLDDLVEWKQRRLDPPGSSSQRDEHARILRHCLYSIYCIRQPALPV